MKLTIIIYMANTYKGKFTPKNKKKYMGDPTQIVYRSLWERQVFRWCDTTDRVVSWVSEEVVVPYRYQVDGKVHKYYVDLLVKFNDGSVVLVEIKPKKETMVPKVPARKTKRYIQEVTTYIKNTDKWQAANAYATKRGWKFEIWHEDTLKSLGIKLIKG